MASLACLPLPKGEVYIPPPIYQEWWQWTESCSGLTRSFSRLTFVEMPGETFLIRGQHSWGYWYDHTIWVSEHHVMDEQVVRHEMLHELIGHPGHPKDLFITKCNLCVGQRCGDT
jgi:hypothetical protein